MTGFGEARHQSDTLNLAVEIRAVNHRFLKIVVRASEPYNLLEPELERVIRKSIRRGTLQVQIRAERHVRPGDHRLNTAALRSYVDQLRRLGAEAGLDANAVAALMSQAAALPGVAPEPGMADFNSDEEWPVVEKVLEAAIGKLQEMRAEEGRRMGDELMSLRDRINDDLRRPRRPARHDRYRDRLAGTRPPCSPNRLSP